MRRARSMCLSESRVSAEIPSSTVPAGQSPGYTHQPLIPARSTGALAQSSETSTIEKYLDESDGGLANIRSSHKSKEQQPYGKFNDGLSPDLAPFLQPCRALV